VGGEGVRVRLSATTTRDTRPGQRKARLLLEVPRDRMITILGDTLTGRLWMLDVIE
jgi:hypothetical protein